MPCVRGTMHGRPFFLSLGGEIHEIQIVGHTWRFEDHPVFGPLVLGRQDQILAKQPGPRSPFWPAFERWSQLRKTP